MRFQVSRTWASRSVALGTSASASAKERHNFSEVAIWAMGADALPQRAFCRELARAGEAKPRVKQSRRIHKGVLLDTVLYSGGWPSLEVPPPGDVRHPGWAWGQYLPVVDSGRGRTGARGTLSGGGPYLSRQTFL